MGTQRQAVTVLYHNTALLLDGCRTKKLIHILEGLGVAHHLHGGVGCSQQGDVRTMVRLHVGDHQIVRRAAGQRLHEVCHPCVGGALVYGIQNGGLFVQNDVGIVADAGRHRVLAFKQVEGGIVHSNAQNGLADGLYAHGLALLYDIVCRKTADDFENCSYLEHCHYSIL